MTTSISKFSLVTEDMLEKLAKLEPPFGGSSFQGSLDLFSENSKPDYSPYYKILNLSENYTKEELEKAYKQARLKYHPDKPDGDKEKFQLSIEAYLKLKDTHE